MIPKLTLIASFVIAAHTSVANAAITVPSDVMAINFKINSNSQVQLQNGTFEDKSGNSYNLNSVLNSASFSKRIKRLHSEKSYDEFAAERIQYEKQGKSLPKLENWYRIPTKGMSESEIQDIMTTLKKMKSIEVAEFETPVISAFVECPSLNCDPGGIWPPGGGTTTPTPDLEAHQGYLGASPLGIDANYAWTKAGGNGSGVKIIDMENSYNQNHEDLPSPFIRKNDSASSAHGTAVLSVIAGKNNNFGVKGIAYGSQIGFYGWGSNTPASIKNAANSLRAGDIIVLEGQINRNIYSGDECSSTDKSECVPMEWNQANFDSIKYATDKGIIVVEAAGNGAENLDSSIYNGRFNRSLRDSGAFMIAATSSQGNFSRLGFSNHGTRIDFNAWGEDVAAAGNIGNVLFDGGLNRIYADGFNGTSSASPIVAGAVASVVGHAKAVLGKTLTVNEVRTLLTNTGVPAPSGSNVGVRPDLRDALNNISSAILPAKPSVRSNWYACYGENNITWGAVSGATSYKVYISSLTTPPANPTYTQTSTQKLVNVGNDTYGWVKACNSKGCGDYSNRVSLRYERYCL